MIRLFIVIAVILIILFVLRSRSNSKKNYSKVFYRNIIILVLVLGLLFFLATSGRFIFPQILNIIKVGLPFLTKFIGI